MTQCKLYARGGGSGSQERGRRWGRWADGADVVFTDTVQLIYSYKTLISTYMEYSSDNVSVAHGTISSS